MKKFLLLSMLAVGAMAANAQAVISVKVEGQPVENGAIVTSSQVVLEQEMSSGAKMYTLNPEVEAASSVETAFDITVALNSQEPAIGAPALRFCWPQNCENPEIGKPSTRQGNLTPEFMSLAIDSETLRVPAGKTLEEAFPNPFSYNTTVTIVEVANPSNKFEFNLIMNYVGDGSGVEGVVADEEAPVYFDLSGRRLLNPEKGQFVIERRGAKAVKIIK